MSISVSPVRLEIVTDKAEYSVGETINSTFYIVNDLPFPVRIIQFLEYDLSGNSDANPNKISCKVNITPASEWATIFIPARSKYRFQQYSFKSTHKGRFTISTEIEGKGASLTVMVR